MLVSSSRACRRTDSPERKAAGRNIHQVHTFSVLRHGVFHSLISLGPRSHITPYPFSMGALIFAEKARFD